MLLNFGSNAVKFTAEGEVVIRVGVLHRTPSGWRCTSRWSTRASGSNPRTKSACSAPSSRPTPRRPDDSAGTGLGLTISRQLIELMGGQAGPDQRSRAKARPSGSSSRCAAPKRSPPSSAAPIPDPLGPAGPGRRRQRHQPEDPAPAAPLVGCRGGRGGGRLPGARDRRMGCPRGSGFRSRRDRPEHAGDGRDGAGRCPEGGPEHVLHHACSC